MLQVEEMQLSALERMNTKCLKTLPPSTAKNDKTILLLQMKNAQPRWTVATFRADFCPHSRPDSPRKAKWQKRNNRSSHVQNMSENNVADLIVSAVIAVAGGALSAYLAKKMIDALDVSKKVSITCMA